MLNMSERSQRSIKIPSSRVRTPAAVELLDGPQRFMKFTGTISTGSLLFRQVFFFRVYPLDRAQLSAVLLLVRVRAWKAAPGLYPRLAQNLDGLFLAVSKPIIALMAHFAAVLVIDKIDTRLQRRDCSFLQGVSFIRIHRYFRIFMIFHQHMICFRRHFRGIRLEANLSCRNVSFFSRKLRDYVAK